MGGTLGCCVFLSCYAVRCWTLTCVPWTLHLQERGDTINFCSTYDDESAVVSQVHICVNVSNPLRYHIRRFLFANARDVMTFHSGNVLLRWSSLCSSEHALAESSCKVSFILFQKQWVMLPMTSLWIGWLCCLKLEVSWSTRNFSVHRISRTVLYIFKRWMCRSEATASTDQPMTIWKTSTRRCLLHWVYSPFFLITFPVVSLLLESTASDCMRTRSFLKNIAAVSSLGGALKLHILGLS